MHFPDHRYWFLLGWGLLSIAFPKLLARSSIRFRNPTPSVSEADLVERHARAFRVTGLVALAVFVGLAFVRS